MVNASQKIRNIMKESNGTISIETLTGTPHTFTLSEDETYIYSDTALGNQKFGLDCFNMVIELLHANGGKAPKGNGRGRENKVGRGKCTVDTICGYIAMNYYGHEEGKSTFDPVFAVCAILEYAGICNNKRGYISYFLFLFFLYYTIN